MTIIGHILCPGPGLESYPGREDAAHVIAVNRAVVAHPCNWWVFSDYQVWHKFPVRACNTPPVPVPVVKQDAIDAIARHPLKYRPLPQHRPWSTLVPPPAVDDCRMWHLYTVGAALVLAQNLGVTRLHTWGMTMRGVDDWDGPADYNVCRTDNRWHLERRIVKALLAWGGFDVTHHSEINL